MEGYWQRFIDLKKKQYKEIGNVFCPALKDFVFFNKYGFIHLQWKDRIPRPHQEQRDRFSLLSDVVEAIRNAAETKDYSESIKKNSKVSFWAIKFVKGNKRIRIILRRKNDGKIHFFSVMIEK